MGATYAWQSSLTKNICQLSPLTDETSSPVASRHSIFGLNRLKILAIFERQTKVDLPGFEPGTFGLQSRRSTTELQALKVKAGQQVK